MDSSIGRITTAGQVTEFPVPLPSGLPDTITAGPDGALWFTEFQFIPPAGNKIGRITVTGAVTEFGIPTPGSAPVGIVTGPDGAIWFTEFFGNNIGRLMISAHAVDVPALSPPAAVAMALLLAASSLVLLRKSLSH